MSILIVFLSSLKNFQNSNQIPFQSYAKNLIEDTIRRNASPVRLDSQDDSSGMPPGNGSLVGIQQTGNQTGLGQMPCDIYVPDMNIYPAKFRGNFGGRSGLGAGPQHSYSTDDASLGEYKYTVNVGQRSIKITGDNLELIRTAKLVLDDYFSSAEFLQSVGDCAADDYNHPYHHGGLTAMIHDGFVGNCQGVAMNQSAVLRDDSGIALDKKSPGKMNPDEIDENNDEDFASKKRSSIAKKTVRVTEDQDKNELYDDDEVFIVDENGKEIPIGNIKSSMNVAKGENGAGSLARSRKSNNLRYSNSPSKVFVGSESE